MKRKTTLMVIALVCTYLTFSQTIIITTIVDGTLKDGVCNSGSGLSSPRFLELYIDGTVNFNGYDLDVETNSLYDTEGIYWESKNISALGTISNQFVFLVDNSNLIIFDSAFSGKTRIGILLGSINGNDSFRIEDDIGNILDLYGNPSEITSSAISPVWDYEDSYVKRKDFTIANEGKSFTGQTSNLEIFSHLLEGNTGTNYQVQSLPKAEI